MLSNAFEGLLPTVTSKAIVTTQDLATPANLSAPIGAAAAAGFPGGSVPAFNLSLSGGVTETPIQAKALPTADDPNVPTGAANPPTVAGFELTPLVIAAAVVAALVLLR